MPLTPPHRFPALDGLRGVAAGVVLAIHTHAMFAGGLGLSHGYLAVDFFFLLSGFVLAHAYAPRMAAGLGLAGLMRLRLARLYPLVLVGTVLGSGAALLDGAPGPAEWWRALGHAVLLLPLDDPAVGFSLWPLNPPSWSLLWEGLGSALFGALLWRLTVPGLARLTLAAALLLAIAAIGYGTLEVGNLAPNFAGGPARALFGFTAGVLLFRWRANGAAAGTALPLPLSAAALVALLAMPGVANRALYDLAAVLFAFPLLLLAAAGATRVGSAWLLAARLSFPLYILHSPVLLATRCLLADTGTPVPLQALAGAGLSVAVAALALQVVERPRAARQPALPRPA
jgi:peptidoglycan/LPS O-acetylase OafA/YrhL